MIELKTLQGLSLPELAAELDKQLPAEAYKAVPGGADLTDIDPNWMRKTFNNVFGVCGLGWGYNYESHDLELFVNEKNQSAALKRLEFWFVLVGADGAQQRCVIPASGGSDNRSAAYALKGAITNAIGNASSNIGFQESVYLGKRDHRTVKAPLTGVKKPAAVTAPMKPAAASKDGTPAVESVTAATRAETGTPGDYVIPIGKKAGKKLSEMSEEWLTWAAEKMAADTPETQELQQAVLTYLAAVKTA